MGFDYYRKLSTLLLHYADFILTPPVEGAEGAEGVDVCAAAASARLNAAARIRSLLSDNSRSRVPSPPDVPLLLLMPALPPAVPDRVIPDPAYHKGLWVL